MLVLFIDFYIKTYVKKPKEKLRAQTGTIKVNNQNNNSENNISKNGVTKMKNGFNKLNHENDLNDVKDYLRNDLSKSFNGNGKVSYNNEFIENVNIFENITEKTNNCVSGKCKMNCHKHYKNE